MLPNFKEMPSYAKYPRKMMMILLACLWLLAIPVAMSSEFAKKPLQIVPVGVVLLVSFMGYQNDTLTL